MIRETKGGALEVRYESDTDIVVVVYPPGKIEEDAARIVIEELTRFMTEKRGEPAFVLVDARHLTGITSEARRAFGGSGVEARKMAESPSYISAFGGSLVYRTLSNLLIKAVMLMSPHTVMRLDADEAASRAWLNEQRRAYLARKAQS